MDEAYESDVRLSEDEESLDLELSTDEDKQRNQSDTGAEYLLDEEDDIYDDEGREEALDDDLIDSEEEAFMRGYEESGD